MLVSYIHPTREVCCCKFTLVRRGLEVELLPACDPCCPVKYTCVKEHCIIVPSHLEAVEESRFEFWELLSTYDFGLLISHGRVRRVMLESHLIVRHRHRVLRAPSGVKKLLEWVKLGES